MVSPSVNFSTRTQSNCHYQALPEVNNKNCSLNYNNQASSISSVNLHNSNFNNTQQQQFHHCRSSTNMSNSSFHSNHSSHFQFPLGQQSPPHYSHGLNNTAAAHKKRNSPWKGIKIYTPQPMMGPCYNPQIVSGSIPFNCRKDLMSSNDSMDKICPFSSNTNECDDSSAYLVINSTSLMQSQPSTSKTTPSPTEDCAETGSADDVRNIKVTDLPLGCTNSELRTLFETSFGPVDSAIVMLTRRGLSRGYGFVLMQRAEDAQAALGILEQRTVCIRGQHIGAHISKKHGDVTSSNIFIGNVPETVSDAMLITALGNVVEFKSGKGRNDLRSAFVELQDKASAAAAIQRIHGANHIKVGDVCVNLSLPLYAKFSRGNNGTGAGASAMGSSSDEPAALLKQESSIIADGSIRASVPPPPGLVSGLWSDELEQDEVVTQVLQRVRELSRMSLPLKDRTVKKYFHKFLDSPETPAVVREEFYALARRNQMEVYKALCYA